jgi:Domain of unknown function (DUF4062)/Tetratricopeptide repeat
MAYFAAREQQPSEYCRQMVSQADVFVGIVGFRYGTPVSDREDVSYTELELRIATEFGIPRLIFVLDEDAELTLPPRHIIDLEYGARQMAFRRRLRGEPGPTLAVVASPAELETRLYQALMELTIDAGGLTSYELTDVVGAPVAAPLGRLPAEVRGRDELLGMLRERRGFVVLTGMGGVGKSTAAAAVARQLRSDRDRDVWWVSAADVTSLAGGIVTVARSLGADDRNLTVLARQTGDGPDRFWKLLDQAPNGWLLVFDNADQPDILAAPGGRVADCTGWVRAGTSGLVLVTSRQTAREVWGFSADVIRLAPLSDTDSGQVLLDLAPNAGDEIDAAHLGHRLGGLPLALHLAGVHLSSGISRCTTFTDYHQALDIERETGDLLNVDADVSGSVDPRKMVMRTWELSLDDLSRHGLPQARPLLRMLSCFAPGVPIPLELLDSELLRPLLPPSSAIAGRDVTQIGVEVEQSLRALARLGLVEIVAMPRSVVVHPVVADTNRAHLRNQRASDCNSALVWHTAVRLVASLIGELDWLEPRAWPRVCSVVPHLQVLHRAADSRLDAEHLVTLIEASRRAILAFLFGGALPDAADLTLVAPTHSSELGETDSSIMVLRHRYAYLTGRPGRWTETESALREVVAARSTALGEDHPATLAARNNLVRLAAFQDRVEESWEGFRQILQAQRRTLGEDHQDTLITRTNLALTMTRLGKWHEAEMTFAEILSVFQQRFTDSHPAILFLRHLQAWTIGNQDRWSEAENLFRQVLDAKTRTFGEHYSSTLLTHHELIWTVAKQGGWAEAEVGFRHVMEARRQLLGGDHPHTLATRHNLAWTISVLNRWPEAAPIFQDVLYAKRRLLGEDHPFTMTTLKALEQHGGQRLRHAPP